LSSEDKKYIPTLKERLLTARARTAGV